MQTEPDIVKIHEDIPQSLQPVNFIPFSPEKWGITCKQRKLMNLQTSFNNSNAQVEPIFKNPDAAYPLCKMTQYNDSASQKSSDLSTWCTRNYDYEKTKNFTSAKELKQYYDTRTFDCVSLQEKPDFSSFETLKDTQKEYNSSLFNMRRLNPEFSDIFGTLKLEGKTQQIDLQDNDKSSQRFKKSSSIKTLSQIPLENQRSNTTGLSARERYRLHSTSQMANDEPYPLKQNETIIHERNDQKTCDIFGVPTVKPLQPCIVHVAMMRLSNIPAHFTEATLKEGIRNCSTYITKIWLPSNTLLGQHNGVGSIIVRESLPCKELVTYDDLEKKSDQSDSGASHSSKPFFALKKWFGDNGIHVTIEEASTE